jgi:hypothetical protein
MSVRVRMYCHGLGDCFLVRFNEFNIVIDCGIIQVATEGSSVLAEVVADIEKTTGGKIDLLVVTHEHYDHMSGFVRKEPAEAWAKLEIRKLWLAWTEDPNDDFANSLRTTRRKTATLVRNAAVALKNNAALGESLKQFANLVYAGPEQESWMQQVQRLVRQKKGEVEYKLPGKSFDLGPESGGVQAIVLGPPRGELIHKSDPSKTDPETYPVPDDKQALALGFSLGATPESIDQIGAFLGVSTASLEPGAEAKKPAESGKESNDYLARLRRHMGLDDGQADSQMPFAPAYRIPMESVDPRLEELPEHLARLEGDPIDLMRGYIDPEQKWRRIDDQWLSVAQTLGLRLDSDTNNTSLALMFRLPDGRCLLFPGDAQVGNWLSWWNQPYEIMIDGERRELTIKQLLGQVVFYKVGHHGRHNATLQEKGLELMPDGLVAMVPVVHDQAVRASWGTNIPLQSIMDRVAAKSRAMVRTDLGPSGDPTTFVVAEQILATTGRPMYYEWETTY